MGGGPFCLTKHPLLSKAIWGRRCQHMDFTSDNLDVKRVNGRSFAEGTGTLTSVTSIAAYDYHQNGNNNSRLDGEEEPTTQADHQIQNVREVLLLAGGNISISVTPSSTDNDNDDGKVKAS